MVDEDVAPMHEDFVRWYRDLGIGGNAEVPQKRWKGICDVVDNADYGVVEVLVRLIFQTKSVPDSAVLQQFRQAFRDADDLFEMKDNNQELKVLAGICLAVLMEGEFYIAGAAALAVTTAALSGGRSANLPMSLELLAENAIDRIAEKFRKRNAIDNTPFPVTKIDFTNVVAKVTETQSFEGVSAALYLAAAATNTVFGTMVGNFTKTVTRLDHVVRVQDEEIDMLWWLIGARSADYDCSFADVPASAQPLVFAKELADCTHLMPGPKAIRSLLSRAGLKSGKTLALSSAICAVTEAWSERAIEGLTLSPVTTPIHFAIHRQLEAGLGTGWVAGWEGATGIKATHAISRLVLGNLLYRERLLLLLA